MAERRAAQLRAQPRSLPFRAAFTKFTSSLFLPFFNMVSTKHLSNVLADGAGLIALTAAGWAPSFSTLSCITACCNTPSLLSISHSPPSRYRVATKGRKIPFLPGTPFYSTISFCAVPQFRGAELLGLAEIRAFTSCSQFQNLTGSS